MNGTKDKACTRSGLPKKRYAQEALHKRKVIYKKKSTKEAQYKRKDGMKEKRFINMSVMKIQPAAQNRSDFKNI